MTEPHLVGEFKLQGIAEVWRESWWLLKLYKYSWVHTFLDGSAPKAPCLMLFFPPIYSFYEFELPNCFFTKRQVTHIIPGVEMSGSWFCHFGLWHLMRTEAISFHDWSQLCRCSMKLWYNSAVILDVIFLYNFSLNDWLILTSFMALGYPDSKYYRYGQSISPHTNI